VEFDDDNEFKRRLSEARAYIDPILKRLPPELTAEHEELLRQRVIGVRRIARCNRLKRQLDDATAKAQHEPNPEEKRTLEAQIMLLTNLHRDQAAEVATFKATMGAQERDLRRRISEAILASVPPFRREEAMRILAERDKSLAALAAATPKDQYASYGTVVGRFLKFRRLMKEANVTGDDSTIARLRPEYEAARAEQARYAAMTDQINQRAIAIRAEYAAKLDSLN